jgi:predicted nucleotidyltransferase
MQHNRQTILACLREGKPELMQQFPLHRLALFGSYARDESSAASDIDILVDVDPTIGLGFVTLAEQLEKLLGQKVDLVSRRAIKPALWKHIEPDIIYV